jgi:hypothetical protein
MATTIEKELRELVFALVLFLAGLGYAVSGLPANIVVGCVIWGLAWVLVTHLFFVSEYTETCPTDVKIVFWAAVTFLVVLFLLRPVQTEYAKEHAAPPLQVEHHEPAPAPAPTSRAPHPPPLPRSYMIFSGYPYLGLHGVQMDAQGKPLADQSWKVGQSLAFNFDIRATGPNAVELLAIIPALYLEDGHEPNVGQHVITKFQRTLKVLWKGHTHDKEFMTLTAGQGGFRTAFTMSETGVEDQRRAVTQEELDAIHSGSKLIFVIVEMTYRDGGKAHHTRMCDFVLPPALFPTAIWETCGGFGNSD